MSRLVSRSLGDPLRRVIANIKQKVAVAVVEQDKLLSIIQKCNVNSTVIVDIEQSHTSNLLRWLLVKGLVRGKHLGHIKVRRPVVQQNIDLADGQNKNIRCSVKVDVGRVQSTDSSVRRNTQGFTKTTILRIKIRTLSIE